MSNQGRKGSKVPAWMVTFADLMTLLLTFFVLLLSFAEIDAQRFKRLAGELQKAFGVQREITADVIPMGTSPVLQQFSPGTPQPIPVDQIYQRLTPERPTLAAGDIDSRVEARLDAIEQQLAQTISEAAPEGNVAVERDGLDIILRIDEQGSFPSGSAQISPSFRQLLEILATELTEIPGYIAVDGHTDNVPIRSARFQSNWDLSAMRAATVTNALLENPTLAPGRFIVLGHADTRPIAPNDTVEQRAKNRRVELIIRAGEMIERELGLRASLEDPLDQAMRDAIETEEKPTAPEVLFNQGLDAIEPIDLKTFFFFSPEPEPQRPAGDIKPDEAPIEHEEPDQEPVNIQDQLGLG
ncbi:MAG: flagellar motor protein MotB [Lamprobacter sp.]|uniref:flagellar motor protein MotB n=1 Tax=Lamprobacter sp. TaxID=3100796 RepID=UPI002B2623B3|nr:flagellar motor protein MotB [Lamprobacter sp.]MEA3639589.1 flagellar motor protein MotB [Lamprobacter sp.]